MSTLRISDAPLLPDVNGTEKIPTGGRGDYAISIDQIKGHIFQDIGKELVGLGNVDNTSDLDKPVSTAQQAALDLKADKTYVDENLDLKADKTSVYTRSETSLALSKKADLVNGVVPENQIPSSFNDVLEFTTPNLPVIGESGKIYVTTDTNKTWRWATNKYVEISGWNPNSVSKVVTLPTYYTREAGVDPVTGVADGAYFNVRSSLGESYIVEYQNNGGVPTPTGKSYPSGAALAEVKDAIIDPETEKPSAAKVIYADGTSVEAANEVQKAKNSLTVDILEFIPKTEWPAIANRTSAYDCTPALVSAVGKGKKVTISQSGTYKLITPYVGTTNFELEATAPGVVLDGNDNIANYVITNSGSASKLTATFTNPSKFDISTTLSDVTGLKVGDWLCFYCPTDFSYSEWRNIYRAGEWKQIRSIVGNIVWFTKPFYDSYAGLVLDLYKLNSVKCKLKNLKLLRKNSLSGFAKFSFSSDAVDENIELDVKVREGILYDRCINQKSINAKGVNEGTGTGSDNDYGIVYANCQHTRVFDADIYSRRHSIALGGGNDICSVPVSDFRCYDSVLSADPVTAVGAADMHGNIRDSSYEDCIIYGGTNIGGGEDCYYKRCKIFSDAKGVCGLGREIIGGNMGWIDCEYHSNGNPQPSGQAVITFGGNDVTTITEKTKKGVTIEVSGKVFGGKDYGAAVSFARIRNRGTSQKINVVLDGLIFNNTSKFAYILNMDVVSGIANSDKIVVDNISGNMPTTNIVYTPETTAGQSYLNKPMRLQKVAGVTTITTTAANFSVSEVVNYPFSYPRRPLTMVTPRGVDGVQKNTFGGQRSVTFGVYSQGLSAMSAMVSSATAMTAGDVIELAYSSEIREC